MDEKRIVKEIVRLSKLIDAGYDKKDITSTVKKIVGDFKNMEYLMSISLERNIKRGIERAKDVDELQTGVYHVIDNIEDIQGSIGNIRNNLVKLLEYANRNK